MSIVLSNCVRVTFVVAPTRMTDSFQLCFSSDFRLVKIETNPLMRSIYSYSED